MTVFLSALATANPKRYATQEEIDTFLASHFPTEPAEKELYRQVLTEGPIPGRHSAVDAEEEICSQDRAWRDRLFVLLHKMFRSH